MAILVLDGSRFRVEESEAQGSLRIIRVNGRPVQVDVLRELARIPPTLLVRAGARTLQITVEESEESGSYDVKLNGKPLRGSIEQEMMRSGKPEKAAAPEGPVLVSSPMAGRIALLKTRVGELVEEGQALVVLEAMKMENEITSPKRGVVKEVYVFPGALVKPGDRLVLVG